MNSRVFYGVCFSASVFFSCNMPTWGQELSPRSSRLGFATASQQDRENLTWTARIESETDRQTAYLIVAAKVPAGGYLYSLTQPGVSATKIEVATNERFRITGAFRPNKAPRIEGDPESEERAETHIEDIEFHLPIQIAAGIEPEDLAIDVRINAQFCQDDQCMPVNNRILTAKLQKYRIPEGNSGASVPVKF
ncbi:MAG: hypothetical protein KF851_07110 [Pirellulaceae bacterium]|nr:hypothetical protein [Pirellulaceae bacterium]